MAGTKGRTARGIEVDFDILKIKAQLANAPKPVEVQERENYIAQKGKRRRTKKEEPQLEEAVNPETKEEEAKESEDKGEE